MKANVWIGLLILIGILMFFGGVIVAILDALWRGPLVLMQWSMTVSIVGAVIGGSGVVAAWVK